MNDTACLFCRIARHEVRSDVVDEADDILAFSDIHPQAPIHILVIPKEHIPSLADLQESQGALVGRLVVFATSVAKKGGLDSYRLVVNCGRSAGQTVNHLHIHLLGGRPLRWPPG